MSTNLAAFEWRYVPSGAVKHALRHASDRYGLCGVGPSWFTPDWYGTGTQTEYETVEALPECRRCLRRLGR